MVFAAPSRAAPCAREHTERDDAVTVAHFLRLPPRERNFAPVTRIETYQSFGNLYAVVAGRRLVALLWLVVLAACAFAAAEAPAAPEDGFSMPGTESQKAFDLLDQRFPGGNSNAADARIVFVAPEGQKVTAGPNKAAIEEIVADVAGGDQVNGALDPFKMAGAVSKDGTTAYSTVSYDVQSIDLTDATTNALGDAAEKGRDAGPAVELGGSALVPEGELGGTTELVGVAAAAVVLLITFGSLAAAGLPLLTAIVGIGVGVASIVAIGMC